MLDTIGADWLLEQAGEWTEEISHITPTQFNEETRYLPESVTSMPGYIRYEVNPFMREIVDCFDVDSPVREVNLKKGVQITYSTALESGALYYMAHVKTLPIMYMTADKELASARIENNFIPMLNQSGLAHIVRSSDEGNTRKTGKTANHIQFEGGGYLVPFGALNANKMRSYSIAVMLKDEIDAWPDVVGKDGDPDALSDDRCSGYWERRKIFRGSTPLLKHSSKIEMAYRRGDQRVYRVHCKACNFPQALRWKSVDKETGVIGGFDWEIEDGTLILESVSYMCQACGEKHFEYDKERLFSESEGAHWHPTARPVEPGIRSYHLPALYSPIGMQPWYKCVQAYLEGYDPTTEKVVNIGKFQRFYNNILAEPFEVLGAKIKFEHVSAHRRSIYALGQIPNKFAAEFCGSRILFLTCQVDVHKSNLAVTVFGWTKAQRSFVIDYWRFEPREGETDCRELACSVWGRLRELIEEKEYISDDGYRYRILATAIDAGYVNDTVTAFCSDYTTNVYPILGRERPAKNQRIQEFGEFKTKSGTLGYRITVDHYKDRLAPVLRREWAEETGPQSRYHWNAPVDLGDKPLKELTAESRKKKTDPRGGTTYYWDRPSGVDNELWDLTVYGHALTEIVAVSICIHQFGLETVDWDQFWQFAASDENGDSLGRLAPK